MKGDEKIYVLKKGKYMYGPYTINDLKFNPLKHGEKIWYEGMEDWKAVEEMEFVAAYIQKDASNKNAKKSLLKRLFNL